MAAHLIVITAAATGAGGLLTGALFPSLSSGAIRNALYGVAGGALLLALMHVCGLDVITGFGQGDLAGTMGQISIGALGGPMLQSGVRLAGWARSAR